MVLTVDNAREAACNSERIAEVMGALASPWRLEIVELLQHGEFDVGGLAAHLGLSVANTSHHITRLRHAGLVVSQRHGTHITNRLASPEVIALADAACRLVTACAANEPDTGDPERA